MQKQSVTGLSSWQQVPIGRDVSRDTAPLPALTPSNWRVQLETSEWRISGLGTYTGK